MILSEVIKALEALTNDQPITTQVGETIFVNSLLLDVAIDSNSRGHVELGSLEHEDDNYLTQLATLDYANALRLALAILKTAEEVK